MHQSLTLPKIVRVLAAVGATSAVGSAVAGIVLARIYRPHVASAAATLPTSSGRASATWSDLHFASSILFLVASMLTLGAVIWVLRERRTVQRPSALVVAAALSSVAAAVTLWTRPMIQWNQLALRAVTTGSDVAGYWYAAFHDVRFVLVGNNEVTQQQYATALIAHLAAPAVGAVLLTFIWSRVARGVRAEISGPNADR